jgi:hypothetical protein
LHGLLNKIFGFHGIPHTNFASGLSFSWLPFWPPPVILVWVTRSNCASAGTVLIVLLKPLGTAHGVLIRPITGHGGFWTNSTKLKTLTICWCSETSGGVLEALGCLPATARMAAKLGLSRSSSHVAVGGFQPSDASARVKALAIACANCGG